MNVEAQVLLGSASVNVESESDCWKLKMRMGPETIKTAIVAGTTIEYADHGEGEPLLLFGFALGVDSAALGIGDVVGFKNIVDAARDDDVLAHDDECSVRPQPKNADAVSHCITSFARPDAEREAGARALRRLIGVPVCALRSVARTA